MTRQQVLLLCRLQIPIFNAFQSDFVIIPFLFMNTAYEKRFAPY